MLNLKTLTTTFNLPLYPRQIPQFRGAVIEKVMRLKNEFVEANISTDLFHNHCEDDTGLHYRYPLIQYQIRHKKASITGINEGAKALGLFLQNNDGKLKMENQEHSFGMTGFPQIQHHEIRQLEEPKTYRLYKWLGLNQKNFEDYEKLDSLYEKVELIERILQNHVIEMLRHLGKPVGEKWDIDLKIKDLHKVGWANVHGNKQRVFDLNFSARVDLPMNAGLGRSTAFGFGKQIPHIERKPAKKDDLLTLEEVLKTES